MLRDAAICPPAVPPLAHREHLKQHHVLGDPLLDRVLPPWCKTVCRYREHFKDTALFFADSEGMEAVAFLYAQQNPYVVALLPLQLRNEALPVLEGLDVQGRSQADLSHFRWEFVVPCHDYLYDSDMEVLDSTHIYVLHGLVFLGQWKVS